MTRSRGIAFACSSVPFKLQVHPLMSCWMYPLAKCRVLIGRVIVMRVSRNIWCTTSKCAPVPIPRDTSSQTLGQATGLLSKHTTHSSPGSPAGYSRCGWCLFAMGALTIGTTGSCNLPASIVGPAMLARADSCALGMIICVLI